MKSGGLACLIGPVHPTFWLSRFFADVWMLFPTEAEYKEASLPQCAYMPVCYTLSYVMCKQSASQLEWTCPTSPATVCIQIFIYHLEGIGKAVPSNPFTAQFINIEEIISDTFDILQWFTKAGFEDVQIKRIGPKWYRGVRRHGLIMGCSVTGRKTKLSCIHTM